MAYFSYRNISSMVPFNAIEPEDESIEEEEYASNENSQLEGDSVEEEIQADVDGENKVGSGVNEGG
jgi:hypothetical protein